jgi:integrase
MTELNLTPNDNHDSIPPLKEYYITSEEVEAMKGGVYPHRDKWRVRFKGDWFFRNEHGEPLYSYRQALNFLEHLNKLGENYEPSLFKNKGPYHFDEAFQAYLNGKKTDSEWHQMKGQVWKKYFKPFFKNMDIREIKNIHIENFNQHLERQGRGGKTVKNILSILHGFLKYHFIRDNIQRMPMFPEVKFQRPRIKWLTEEEVNQVFEFLDSQDLSIFTFIKTYGCRGEEASGLLRNKIQWETKSILIDSVYVNGKLKPRTKTSKARELPIIPEIVEHLQPKGDSIFLFHVDGKPYSEKMLQRRWHVASLKANNKYGTRIYPVSKLRHSWATQRRKQGFTLEQIGEVLGHSDIRVTRQHYADIDTGELIQIVRGRR